MLLTMYQSLPDTNRSTVWSLKHRDTTSGSESRLFKSGRLQQRDDPGLLLWVTLRQAASPIQPSCSYIKLRASRRQHCLPRDGRGLAGTPFIQVWGQEAWGAVALQVASHCRLSICTQEHCGPTTRQMRRWHLRFSDPAVPSSRASVTSVQTSVAPVCPCGNRKTVWVCALHLTPCSRPCGHSLVSGQEFSQDRELIFQWHFWGEAEEQLHRVLCDQRTLVVHGQLPPAALPPGTASTETCLSLALAAESSCRGCLIPLGQAVPPVAAHPCFPPAASASPEGPRLGVHSSWCDGPAVGASG